MDMLKHAFATILLAFAFLGLHAASPVAKIHIFTVDVQYLTAENFKHIAETITGDEDMGEAGVVRTDPENRDGMYFVLQLSRYVKHIPQGGQVTVQYTSSSNPQVTSKTLPLSNLNKNGSYLYVGITGPDWPNPDASITAWKVTLQDSDGNPIAEKKSFTWNQPKSTDS